MLVLDHRLQRQVSALVIRTTMGNTLTYLQALSHSKHHSHHTLENTQVIIKQNNEGDYFYRVVEKRTNHGSFIYSSFQPMHIIHNVNKEWIQETFALTPLQLHRWLQAHWKKIIRQLR